MSKTMSMYSCIWSSGMDKELTNGLWVRTKGRAGTGDVIGSATGHPTRKT